MKQTFLLYGIIAITVGPVLSTGEVHAQNSNQGQSLPVLFSPALPVEKMSSPAVTIDTGKISLQKQAEDILDELMQRKIITGKVGTTFTLNFTELIVNGVTQSKELHQKLKAKFNYKPKDFINFYSSDQRTDIGGYQE